MFLGRNCLERMAAASRTPLAASEELAMASAIAPFAVLATVCRSICEGSSGWPSRSVSRSLENVNGTAAHPPPDTAEMYRTCCFSHPLRCRPRSCPSDAEAERVPPPENATPKSPRVASCALSGKVGGPMRCQSSAGTGQNRASKHGPQRSARIPSTLAAPARASVARPVLRIRIIAPRQTPGASRKAGRRTSARRPVLAAGSDQRRFPRRIGSSRRAASRIRADPSTRAPNRRSAGR